MTEPGAPAPNRNARVVLGGCAGCFLAMGGLAVLAVLVVVGMFWRRDGEPITFSVEVVGEPPAPSGPVAYTFHAEAEIPFVTRGFMGTSNDLEQTAIAHAEGNALSVELLDGLRSIRDEQLSYVDLGRATFGSLDAPTHGTPEIRTGGYEDLLEQAITEDDVATWRGNVAFLPSTIYYVRGARTVRAIIDVQPVPIARFDDDSSDMLVPPGVATAVRVQALRTGGTYETGRYGASTVGATVSAVVVDDAGLTASLGWSTCQSPMPVTPEQWRTLMTHALPNFAVTITASETGATVSITPAATYSTDNDIHLVAMAAPPGWTLAGAVETILTPMSYDEYDDEESDE